MKAVVIHSARDLRTGEAEIPPLGPHEVQVRIRAGGICGSDLHYYQHGGFGTVRIREPLIPGHEIAGEVVQAGAAVTRVNPGDRVAVNPSRPCGHCALCLEGKPRHCLDMRFLGSAMRFPHVQGGFREILVCTEDQAVPIPAGLAMEHAAFAEPLSVCLHAAVQAGPLLGKRVLVTGCGPIGALCILVARQAGARQVVVTDLADAPLAIARKIGADLAIDMREDPGGLDRFHADKGAFDVVFEGVRQRRGAGRRHPGRPSRRRHRPGRPGRRGDAAGQHPGRQGDPASGHVPLRRGVRMGRWDSSPPARSTCGPC